VIPAYLTLQRMLRVRVYV